MSSKKRVLIGMSGGIDSSVAAYLLKKEGFDVIGITLKTWENVSKSCSIDDILHAKKVAKKLNIQHYVIDNQKNFYNYVIKYFLNEYIEGRTPSPCILCNRYIKFAKMYELLKNFDADYISTGHYVNMGNLFNTPLVKRGIDYNKEQSYFLSLLDDEIRRRSFFIMGNYKKEEIKRIYKEFYGEPFHKKESQDLCFVSKGHYGEFIIKNTGIHIGEGDILFRKKIVGKHKGYIYYTVGQRKHLGISYKEPLYIKKIVPKRNQIILETKEHIVKNLVYMKNPIFHIPYEVLKELEVEAKFHYRSSMHKGHIIKNGNRYFLDISKNPEIITPGQLISIYYKDHIVAAAWQ